MFRGETEIIFNGAEVVGFPRTENLGAGIGDVPVIGRSHWIALLADGKKIPVVTAHASGSVPGPGHPWKGYRGEETVFVKPRSFATEVLEKMRQSA